MILEQRSYFVFICLYHDPILRLPYLFGLFSYMKLISQPCSDHAAKI